jgi:hypothetical protein
MDREKARSKYLSLNTDANPTNIQDMKRQIEKLWGDEPKWFTRNTANTKYIRTFKDRRKFTIILPCNPRASWWRDIMDRTMDIPIPIPGGKTTALAAFRIGNSKEGKQFRAKLLLQSKGKDIMADIYRYKGKYPKFGYQQMEFTIERLKKLATWDKTPGTSPPEVEDDDPDPTGWDDWHPTFEKETEANVMQMRNTLLQKLKETKMPQDRCDMVMVAIDNNISILKNPRAGDITHFECTLDVVKNFREFHSNTRGGISEFESKVLAKTIAELWNTDCIEDSTARVSSNIKLVPKPKSKDKLRLCINYVRANREIKSIDYPVPSIQNAFDKMKGAKYFSVIDLRKGYWSIPIRPQDRWITSFRTPQGFFQWKVLPMGIKTASPIFSQAVDQMLSKKYESQAFREQMGDDADTNKFVFAYVDDIIIFSKTEEEHTKQLNDILRRVKEFGFKINAQKCSFFQTSVQYLGHIISHNKIQMSNEKINAMKNIPRPTTAAGLLSAVSAFGFYSKFLGKPFVEICKPLREMIKCNDMKWTDKRQNAFKRMKDMGTSDKVLTPPDFSKEFTLDTDASSYAVGGVLAQAGKDGELRPVMFMGRKLTTQESRYCTRDQELLALIYCVSRARKYLHGRRFKVRTDHINLCWLFEANTYGRVARWAAKLGEYDFYIEHIKGKNNIIPDYISRNPISPVAAFVAALTPDKYNNMSDLETKGPISNRPLPEGHISPLTVFCCEMHKQQELEEQCDWEWNYITPIAEKAISQLRHPPPFWQSAQTPK